MVGHWSLNSVWSRCAVQQRINLSIFWLNIRGQKRRRSTKTGNVINKLDDIPFCVWHYGILTSSSLFSATCFHYAVALALIIHDKSFWYALSLCVRLPESHSRKAILHLPYFCVNIWRRLRRQIYLFIFFLCHSFSHPTVLNYFKLTNANKKWHRDERLLIVPCHFLLLINSLLAFAYHSSQSLAKLAVQLKTVTQSIYSPNWVNDVNSKEWTA